MQKLITSFRYEHVDVVEDLLLCLYDVPVEEMLTRRRVLKMYKIGLHEVYELMHLK